MKSGFYDYEVLWEQFVQEAYNSSESLPKVYSVGEMRSAASLPDGQPSFGTTHLGVRGTGKSGSIRLPWVSWRRQGAFVAELEHNFREADSSGYRGEKNITPPVSCGGKKTLNKMT